MVGSIQIRWQCLSVRTEKKKYLRCGPASQRANFHFTNKIVLATYSSKPQGGALCLNTKAWDLQSVLKQGFVVGVYVTLPP
jgi:hypothetical protein